MLNTIQVEFKNIEKELQETVMGSLTAIAGLEGFEQKDTELIAYFREAAFNQRELEELLPETLRNFTLTTLPEQNWNALWESNFEPVTVTNFCSIRANFHEPVSDILYDIVVTPKMSFGTGHHATTYQVIASMSALNVKGKKVADFGTGTGVLAILAEKMGAMEIIAIDNDDWSIENAKENIGVNQCLNINLIKGEELIGNEYDIILANINKNVLLYHMEALKNAMKPDGILVLSGILNEDEHDMLAAVQQQNMVLSSRSEKNNWLCLVIHKQID